MENITKSCKKCNKELVVDETTGKANFYKDKFAKDGYMSVCKDCDNSYQKSWREKIKALKATKVEVLVEA
jgi:hypothetical protein